MSETTTKSGVRCVIVTPEQTVLDTSAEFIALPLFDGEIGIGRGHSPMIGRLGYGELRIRTSGDTKHYYVDGGFVQVADNLVSVLTNSAKPAADVNADLAQEQITEALGRKTTGDDQLVLRDRTLAQNRAQLRTARRAK